MAEQVNQRLLRAALEREAEAQRLLLDGDGYGAAEAFREVSDHYRRSWESAHAGAYGRLVGMLKAAVLAGPPAGTGAGGAAEAAYVRRELAEEADSPTSAYALALAALVEGDDRLAERAAERMAEPGGGPAGAFERTAAAISALAGRDSEAYAGALAGIIADFEGRAEHLTGVAIADTAVVLERLAEPRGMAVRPRSPLLP